MLATNVMPSFKALRQGAYNSGKHGKPGNIREFSNSGILRENSGNFQFTQGFFLLYC
jgi:hypothetical protein